MIQSFRKKPVIIQAVQYNNLNKDEIESFVGKELQSQIHDAAYQAGQGPPVRDLLIETLEGVMIASPNDYIIKGVNGEFYPCKPDIFEKSYELVENV